MSNTSMSGAIDSYLSVPSYEDYLEQARTPKQDLEKKDFLSLLAAQMKYQNPLEPMTDTAFVAQLAQFSQLEQLDSLNKTMTQYQYFNLAGKYVYTEGNVDGVMTAISGVVDRVLLKDGIAYVEVGGYQFEAGKVTSVYDKDIFTGGASLTDGASLIGRRVEAEIAVTDEDGKNVFDDDGNQVTRKATGTVTGVTMLNGMLAVVIRKADGARETVHVNALTSIHEVEETAQTPAARSAVATAPETAPSTPVEASESNPTQQEPLPEAGQA